MVLGRRGVGLEIVSNEFCALVHVRELACFKPWCR